MWISEVKGMCISVVQAVTTVMYLSEVSSFLTVALPERDVTESVHNLRCRLWSSFSQVRYWDLIVFFNCISFRGLKRPEKFCSARKKENRFFVRNWQLNLERPLKFLFMIFYLLRMLFWCAMFSQYVIGFTNHNLPGLKKFTPGRYLNDKCFWSVSSPLQRQYF